MGLGISWLTTDAILAISGLHLSFAGLGAYRLFRRLTGSYKAGGLTGGMLLFLYVSMIGMTVSVLRAWVMFLFRVGADVTGENTICRRHFL
ncbi:MAG: ComEC/Rec2 family competence protein [Dorea longicatena]